MSEVVELKKKVALVTGCSKGIGKMSALELAKYGNHIAINYKSSKAEAEQLATLIEQTYDVTAFVVQGDITSYEECKKIVQQCLVQFGRIDILVNNAGPYIYERKSMIDYEISEWNDMINGNLSSVFYLCKLIIPEMRKQRWGRIINMGFHNVESAPAWVYRSAFGAAKVGLASLTKTLAHEEAPYGITVNMVSPGDIRGDFKECDIEQSKANMNNSTLVKRSGTGADVSRVISFLCEENSDFLTGCVIPVTGGKDALVKSYLQHLKSHNIELND